MERWLELLLGEGGVERTVNGIVWGVPSMALLLGTGLALSVLCGFPQFTKIGAVFRGTAGRLLRPQKNRRGALSPFQAMCTALAASIGTGNIAGVSGAIALGGPGAVFWMWVSALLGMCTKYCEVTLAVRYRERNAQGEWVGGPMYYIRNGLGRKRLAALFAVFGGLASFGIGNLAQMNTVAASVNSAVSAFADTTGQEQFFIALAVGAACGGIVFAVLSGGMGRIGDVCALLVPVMALLYVLAALAVIAAHAAGIPGALRAVVVGAFCPRAAAGGLAGITLRDAAVRGIGRGVFSNEAGLGSAPMAHAAADTDSPAAQGLFGIFEVFMDTIVICTMTALVILLGVGVDCVGYGRDQGAALAAEGFRSVFAGPLPAVALALFLALFALSTVFTWGLYGLRCFEFLLGPRVRRVYLPVFALCAVLGAVMELDTVWHIADTLNGLMALPNLTALLLLSPEAARLTRAYFAGR